MQVTPDILLQAFVNQGATDLYLTVGAPPSMRLDDKILPYGTEVLQEEDIQSIMSELFSDDIIAEFESTLEYNTAIDWRGKARIRVNLFRQRQNTGIVMRRIHTDIPTLTALNLPPIYGELIMEKRGLVLVVGPTGSGKSTSLAAMLEHRNKNGSGHIITIEDPIEFIHRHGNCIITQRDVGLDTYSYGIALKNALRQSPDVIVIGEIRDKETMEQAMLFSETGHLCIATLHANNTHQALERVMNFFPQEKHLQILISLSFNLKAIMSQRLVPNTKDSRSMVVELMRNQGLIKNLIHDNRIMDIRECIEKGHASGMQTFEQALMELYISGMITEETALAECDNVANLRVAIKQHIMSKNPSLSRNAPLLESIPNSRQQF